MIDENGAYDGIRSSTIYKMTTTFHYVIFIILKYNEYVTRYYDIMAGVTQGSVLGPTLYLIFIADVPSSDRVLTCTFADDTAILLLPPRN